MSFWGELKRRDVFKVAAAYLVASWLIVQVVSVLTDPLDLPAQLDTVVVVLLAIGFPFALIIAWIYEVTPDGIRVTSENTKYQSGAPSQRLTFVLVGLCVLAVGLMAVGRFASQPTSNRFGTGSRLAILPCTDLSPDPTNAFFAPGIHQELIRQLGSLAGLEVISPSSVQRYAGSQTPAPQVAEELQVHAVMECTARYSGDQVRLTTLLVDGTSAASLWSSVYPGDMSNLSQIFQIQADIAMEVANALQVEFLDVERQRIERLPTESREAYELYLSALALNGTFTYDALYGGRRLTDAAIELDPEFAEAWSLKATYHGNLSYTVPTEDREIERDGRRLAVQRALELDPDLASAQVALAGVLASEGDFIGAEASYRRALELNSSMVFDGASPWVLRMTIADFEGARAVLEAVRRDDPLNALARAFGILLYGLLGDIERAEREFELVNQLFPVGLQDWFMIVVRLGADENASLDDIDDAWLLEQLGRDLLDSPEKGLEVLRRNYELAESIPDVLAQQYAQWAAFWGDAELALEIMDPIVRSDAQNAYYFWPANMREVRQLDGFKSLLADIGLVDYWNEFGWPDICRPIANSDFVCN